jgi:hypothetical protein
MRINCNLSRGPGKLIGRVGMKMYALSWPRVWLLLLAVVISLPTSASAQYDLSTCNGVLNYCVEQARRAGNPTSQCASDYQECQRTGVKANRNIDNPYAAPMQRSAPAQLQRFAPAQTYPNLPDRRDPNNPYLGPIDRQFCAGRVNCFPMR